MKNLFSIILSLMLSTSIFAQVKEATARIRGEALQLQEDIQWDSSIPKECFCCNDKVYNLPKPPPITGTTLACACDPIKFATMNCPGATYNWTVTDDKGNVITFSGTGNAITLNYTLAQQIASGATGFVVTVEIRCGNKVVKNTIKVPMKPIPPANVSFSLTDDGAGNFTALANTLAPANGNGWTLKEVTCPGPNPCSWVPGGIKWQTAGNTANIPSGVLVKGKCYVLIHYVNVCSPTWVAGSCTVYKAICFTVSGNQSKMMKMPDDKQVFEISAEMLKEVRAIKE